jgi:hypothetical protein
MPSLRLTEAERRELRRVLKSYVSDLRMEISNTDSFDFRQGLKRREALLKRLLEQLRRRQGVRTARPRKAIS